jgi:hypothetical protein
MGADMDILILAIALVVPLWVVVTLLVLAFFRGARICSDDDEDALRTRQNAAGSTIAGAKLPTHQRHPKFDYKAT